jgi:hypothetical protein
MSDGIGSADEEAPKDLNHPSGPVARLCVRESSPMTTLLHRPGLVHFSPPLAGEDTTDYSADSGPSPDDEAERLALVAAIAGRDARDEAFARMERRGEFERWVESMEARYGNLDGPPSDDERAGIIGRNLPYED